MRSDKLGEFYRVSDVDTVIKELQNKILELENKIVDLELDLEFSEHGTP